jgi:CII-binding regulator of phage lambda lysogenization HflD
MNPEIINLYIDRLLQEITELIKNKLLIETQLRYTERINAEFASKIKDLESQLEKLNKKKQKEVNTSNQF